MAEGFTDADVDVIEFALGEIHIGTAIKDALFRVVDDQGEYALRLLSISSQEGA